MQVDQFQSDLSMTRSDRITGNFNQKNPYCGEHACLGYSMHSSTNLFEISVIGVLYTMKKSERHLFLY